MATATSELDRPHLKLSHPKHASPESAPSPAPAHPSEMTSPTDLTSSTLSLPDSSTDLPPLAALFLVIFDLKAGYTLRWSRTSPSHPISLSGVEFQSLPSGLHRLQSDLIYFLHSSYAGISYFLNAPAPSSSRGAFLFSIGALLPLSHNRLGRSWRHAAGLQELAKSLAENQNDYSPLEAYFTAHSGPQRKPSHPRRTLSLSDPHLNLTPSTPHLLSPLHPARALPELLGLLGPLLFPLHRLALARKRILIVTHPPVARACNYVYILSILSNIPLSAVSHLPASENPPNRLKPLFCVGVHDIPDLETEKEGYVACTTDEILAMKTGLYDVLVRLPDPNSKSWPTIETPVRGSPPGTPGAKVLATQRDLRRWRTLRRDLARRYPHLDRIQQSEPPAEETDVESDVSDEVEEGEEGVETVCESLSWREIAYSGFVWWASAGDTGRGLVGEVDEEAMDRLPSPDPSLPPHPPSSTQNEEGEGGSASGTEDGEGEVRRRRSNTQPLRQGSSTIAAEAELMGPEIELIVYFHRITHRIISTLSSTVNNFLSEPPTDDGEIPFRDDEDEDAELLQRLASEERVVFVSVEDLETMGLDRYSEADAKAVGEILMRWWGGGVEVGGREKLVVEVQRWRFRCCGIECG